MKPNILDIFDTLPIDRLGHDFEGTDGNIRYEIKRVLERRLSAGVPIKDPLQGGSYECRCCQHRLYFAFDPDTQSINLDGELVSTNSTDWVAVSPKSCANKGSTP